MSCKPEAEGANHPTDANATAVLYVQISPALRQRFKAACASRGLSMREQIISLMESDVATLPAAQPIAAGPTR